MKVIIDINDNEYMGIKEYPNNVTSYPVTIHIYDAIRKGVPLEDMLDKIRAEIEEVINENEAIDSNNSRAQNIGLMWVLQIIDKHKGEDE